MHATHALQTHQSDLHDSTLQQLHHQQQQQQHHESQQTVIHSHNESPIMDQSNMTVLENLNPSQPLTAEQHQQQVMGGMIEPVQQQQQHVVQHLVQNAGQQQPHLHQLQPSHNSIASMDSTSSQLVVSPEGAAEQQHQQQVGQQHPVMQQQQCAARIGGGSGNNHLMHQRPQIEGIVSDGGGPIVQWLLDNYEIADGESLPRSTVYNHYLAHCRQLQMASVNAASFGKLIRSVFIGLKTRRLGTRGHSKYHYFGVRAKQHIQQELMQHQSSGGPGCSRDLSNNENSNQNTENGSESEDSGTGNGLDCGGRLSSSSSGKRVKRSGLDSSSNRGQRNNQIYQQQQEANMGIGHQNNHHQHHHDQIELGEANGVYYTTNTTTNTATSNSTADTANTNGYAPAVNRNNLDSKNTQHNSNNTTDHLIQLPSMDQNHCELADFRNHLGANWATLVDEHWPQREDCDHLERQLVKVTGSSELADGLKLFESKYKTYYKRMVELLSELKFLEVEQLWREFWNPNPNPQPHEETHWPPNEATTLPASGQLANGTNQSHQQNGQQQQQQQSTGDIVQRHIDYQQQQQHNLQQSQVQLDFHHLYQLTSQPIVIERINQIDYSLYDAIESFLLPDMLSPIPSPLAVQIRQFAENIGPWIKISVKDYDPNFVCEKSKSARAFGSALRRYESLNRLSTASRAIWEKRSSLAQMSIDLSRVDLRDIEHQVSLMSRSNSNDTKLYLLGDAPNNNTNDNSVDQSGSSNSHLGNQTTNTTTITTNTTSTISGNVANDQQAVNNENNLLDHHRHQTHHLCTMQPGQLIQNFLHLLEDPYPANSWPDWCRNLVESRVCGPSIEEARNFVLRWNFYISLIMKELTLRSAPSFASFLLIKSLFDEYIFYLVVSRLAQAQHKTPAQLLSS